MKRENDFERVAAIVTFLQQRPERRIVVVSHGGIMTYILAQKLGNIERYTVKTSAMRAPSPDTKLPPGKILAPKAQCSVCLAIAFDRVSGVACRYRRADFSICGCGRGVCWLCMASVASTKYRITQ